MYIRNALLKDERNKVKILKKETDNKRRHGKEVIKYGEVREEWRKDDILRKIGKSN